MRKEESTKLEALEALMAERRKHEGYLAKLEERRDGTPDGVYLKLRDEYLTKLTDAQVRAAAEAESLAEGLDEGEAAVAEVEERLAAFEAEKIEGELRAAVGEFEPKEWTKRLTALKASISMAEKERDAHATAFERLRTLLAEAQAGPNVGPPRVVGDAAAASAAKMRATSAMKGGPSFDELAFLKSVVGRHSTPTPAVPQDAQESKPVAAIVESPSAPKPPKAAEPEPEAPAKSRATPAKAAAQVAAEPEPTESASTKPPVVESPPAPVAERPPADPESASNNAFGKPTPRTSQAVKTLKCQECGTFNYPTEWYCERCGGELAAL